MGVKHESKKENTGFVCDYCYSPVKPLENGSYRNHCPYCLHSKHLDDIPGDRASQCLGLMKPIGRTIHSKKGIQIIHQCQDCGHIMVNKIAEGLEGDDIDIIISLPIK